MISRVIGLDPGPQTSALVVFDGTRVEVVQIASNEEIIHRLRIWSGDPLAIEKVESYGMAVGAETFETVFWSGRFAESYDPAGTTVYRIGRKEIKLHLCGSVRATDSNIRAAIYDKYGGKPAAVGSKANPGPLYHVKSHAMSALAVAITWYDKYGKL